jgi:hypothetical protein
MVADRAVHARLGGGRLVGLVVAVAAIADQVDDDVAAELHAVVEGQPADQRDRIRIVGIHMEDRRLDHLRHVAAVRRGTGVLGMAGREPDLVIDDDVNRAAGGEAARLRHLQGLHDHALAREGGIAVDQDRQHGRAGLVLAPVLPGPHRADHHRVDDLQVRRIEREGDVDIPARRADVRREPEVVLDVAGAPLHLRVIGAFELREQRLRRLAEHVDQHVQAAPMRHADHDLLHAPSAGLLDDVAEQRNHALAALERKALLADVAGVQVALDALGAGEALQQVAPVGVLEPAAGRGRLESALQPEAFLGIGDMPEFGRDRAAVDALEPGADVAETQPVRAAETGRREHRVIVRRTQPMETGIEFGQRLGLDEPEGSSLASRWPRRR